MRHLKYLLPISFLFFAIASCKKNSTNIKKTTTLDTDALLHSITLHAPIQYVATSVNADTLQMIYYENVNLYIPTTGYTYSYALHLIEDFSATLLKNVNYTTIDQSGDVTYDYVDDNLNDVSAKSVKDTTIAGIPSKNIVVQRPFIFKKPYPSAQLALAAQDSVDAVTNNVMNFHSYVYFTKTYPASSVSTPIYFVKQ
jgi:hypothetical protein